jgi:proteasome alpha subunit
MSEIRIVIPDKVDRYLDSLVRTGMFSSKAELFRAALMDYLGEISSVAKEYDSKIMFSPEGRIYQLEYARESSLRGTPVVGIRYSQGILFVHPDMGNENVEYPPKIYMGKNFMAAFAGLAADGLYVMGKMKEMGYSEDLLFKISEILWDFTTKIDRRPLGTSIMVATENGEIAVFDPSGAFHYAKYWAIGDGGDEIIKILKSGYRENMSKEDALTLALRALGNPERYKMRSL